MVSIEVMLNSTLSHLVSYTTALESILGYHLEECHSNRQALAQVPQPADNNPAPQGPVTIRLQRPPPSMESLKFGIDTFHPGPAATHDLQPLRSFGIVPEGIPETLAVVARSPQDTKLCIGPKPQDPEGNKVDEIGRAHV